MVPAVAPFPIVQKPQTYLEGIDPLAVGVEVVHEMHGIANYGYGALPILNSMVADWYCSPLH